MVTVGVFEAKNTLSELIEKVEAGEEIVITRRGQPVARLVPPRQGDSREQRERAVAALREARKGVRLRGLSLRKLIDEGRR
jgi:prevent-host-death family protein